jgi:sugar lactone lactonase YvrE
MERKQTMAGAGSVVRAACALTGRAVVGGIMLVALRGCGGDLAAKEAVACDPVCAGLCEAGRCIVTLASGQNAPDNIVVDAASVYWTNAANFGEGAVMKVPLGGGPLTTLAASQSFPMGLAVDATSVYWTTFDWTTDGEGTVMKAPIGGGDSTTLAFSAGARFMVVDARRVYWASSGGRVRGVNVGASVSSVPTTGGTSTELVTAFTPWRLAINATSLFWTDTLLKTVTRMPLDGGPTAPVAVAQPGVGAIVVDAASVYWSTSTDHAHGNIMRAPIGGGPATMLATDQEYATSMAVDETSLYWTTVGSSGAVIRLSLHGGSPVVLASGQISTRGIAVDSTSVYWTDGSRGTVMKVTPK